MEYPARYAIIMLVAIIVLSFLKPQDREMKNVISIVMGILILTLLVLIIICDMKYIKF